MKIPCKLLTSGSSFATYATNQHRSFSKMTAGGPFFDSKKEKFIKKVETLTSVTFPGRSRPKEAAVLVPLCIVDEEPSVLFTVRSSCMTNHKGEVSFPGGMKDARDESSIHTAIREAEEEIGVHAKDVEIWTTMPPILSRTGMIWITPVVAFVGDVVPEKCEINSAEVDTVFSQSLEFLCCEKNWRSTQMKIEYTLPVFLGSNYRIWGVTSFILHTVLENLCPEFYRRKLNYKKLKRS